MTREEREKKNRAIGNAQYDDETKRYIMLMCKKGCKFYNNKTGCTKKRIIRVCAKRGLKNKE